MITKEHELRAFNTVIQSFLAEGEVDRDVLQKLIQRRDMIASRSTFQLNNMNSQTEMVSYDSIKE
jgi:hypothetical protein